MLFKAFQGFSRPFLTEKMHQVHDVVRLPGVSELSKHQLAEICSKESDCVGFFWMCPGDVAPRLLSFS